MKTPSRAATAPSVEPTRLTPESPFPFDPVIEAYKSGVDRTLLIENLKLTPEQRIMNLQSLYDFSVELRRAKREAQPAG